MDSDRVAFRCRCCQASLVLLLPTTGWTAEAWATMAKRAAGLGWSYSPEGMWRVCPDCAEAAREAVRREERGP